MKKTLLTELRRHRRRYVFKHILGIVIFLVFVFLFFVLLTAIAFADTVIVDVDVDVNTSGSSSYCNPYRPLPYHTERREYVPYWYKTQNRGRCD